MENIVEGFIRAAVSIIRWILWDIFVQVVIFNLGYYFLLLITLGNYPNPSMLERDSNKIYFSGIGVIVLAWLGIVIYNNYFRW
jgi:hypothetical protein